MGNEKEIMRRNADLIALAVLVLALGFGSLGDGAVNWLAPRVNFGLPLVKEWSLDSPFLDWRLAPPVWRLQSRGAPGGGLRQEVECAGAQARRAAEELRRHFEELRRVRPASLRGAAEF